MISPVQSWELKNKTVHKKRDEEMTLGNLMRGDKTRENSIVYCDF